MKAFSPASGSKYWRITDYQIKGSKLARIILLVLKLRLRQAQSPGKMQDLMFRVKVRGSGYPTGWN